MISLLVSLGLLIVIAFGIYTKFTNANVTTVIYVRDCCIAIETILCLICITLTYFPIE